MESSAGEYIVGDRAVTDSGLGAFARRSVSASGNGVFIIDADCICGCDGGDDCPNRQKR